MKRFALTCGALASVALAGAAIWVATATPNAQAQAPFHLEEATIADVQRAIQQGQTTCQGIVQAYIERAKAYNGVSNALLTEDGAPIPAAPGGCGLDHR